MPHYLINITSLLLCSPPPRLHMHWGQRFCFIHCCSLSSYYRAWCSINVWWVAWTSLLLLNKEDVQKEVKSWVCAQSSIGMTPSPQAPVCGCLWERKHKSKLIVCILGWMRMRFFNSWCDKIIWATKHCRGLSNLSELVRTWITFVLDDLDTPLPEDRWLGQVISESTFSAVNLWFY